MTDQNSEPNVSWIDTLHRRASSASVVCETEDGRLLIIKANYKHYWTVPGGVVDPGETPLQAAVRETSEEVNIDLNPDDLTFMYVANRKSSVADSYQFIFRTKISNQMLAGIRLQATEIDDYDLITKERALTGDRHYGKVVRNWVNDVTGYCEQTITVSN